MAENSAIEWTHHTWSPWEGCQKTGSPACDHCYAEARNARFGGGVAPNWGPHAERRLTADASWSKPLAWDRAAARRAARERVFPSLCDPFDNRAPEGARERFGRLILATPNLDWLLLTKRIGNAATMLAEMFPAGVPANVWLGATVVTQAEADRDVPVLLAIAGPRVRFLSMEPLMEAIDLTRIRQPQKPHNSALGPGDPPMLLNALTGVSYFHHVGRCLESPFRTPSLDWIIVGGESGPGARPMHPDWARSLRDQCAAAGVPFLFKQWGEWAPVRADLIPIPRERQGWVHHDTGALMQAKVEDDLDAMEREERRAGRPLYGHIARFGKKAAGRLLDGVQHDGLPA